MDLRLQGSTALVTGTARSIGFAIAQGLAREGCHSHRVARAAADWDSARTSVRVVGVNPGQIDTDRLRSRYEGRAKAELGDPDRWQELIKNAPFGRLATADEVADAMVWLASPSAAYISGTALTVDGGRAVRNL